MTVFVISDLHLGHKGIITFKDDDGRITRPFETLHHMHQCICDHWQDVVGKDDKIYVLGDVAMSKSVGKLLRSLPGNKRLVRGNHDLFSDKWYHDAGFQRLYGVRQIDGVWLTHVPMHPCSLSGRAIGNIHGHLHQHVVEIECPGGTHPDRRYFNACVEQINYQPIAIAQIVMDRNWKTML